MQRATKGTEQKCRKQNAGVIRQMYEAAGRGDMPTALSFLDPAVVVHEQESLPYRDTYHVGHAGFQELFQDLMRVWDEFTFVTPLEFSRCG